MSNKYRSFLTFLTSFLCLFLAARTLSSVEHSAPQARYIREVEYSVSSQQGDTSGGSGANSPPKSNSNSLNWSPQWVEGPKGDLYIGPSGYITLHYEAVGVNKLMFKCNDRFVPTKNASTKIGKSSSGVNVISATLNVTREEVERQVTVFWCQCVGFTLDMLDGNISSVPVNIHLASLRKEFPLAPLSKKVQVGSDLELKCVPPQGVPVPTITWYKRDPLTPPELNGGYGRKLNKGDRHYLIQNNRTLVIGSAGVEDSGKFTCVASNQAGTRYSPVATVQVYRDGAWSGWTTWGECVVEDKGQMSEGQGGTSSPNCGKGVQMRTRACDNPSPLNDGLPCIGEKLERSNCAIPCSDGSGWTPWSQWSSCEIPEGKSHSEHNCRQTRTRTCAINYATNTHTQLLTHRGDQQLSGTPTCVGDSQQSRACSTELCQHILEEEAGIILTPPGNMEAAQNEKETLSTQLVLYMSFIIALIVAVIIIVMVGLWMQRRRRRFLVGGTTLTLSSSDDAPEQQRKQSNHHSHNHARKGSSVPNGNTVLIDAQGEKSTCCCCYGGNSSTSSRCPLSLFCAGICCPTAGRGPNGGRSAPSSGGHYDNADKYTQQRHQFMGGEQNAGGGICQSMTCNTVIPSFHELPHTVSASSFYPTQTGGYNSCFSIDKCTPQNIVPSNSYHSLHAQMFTPRFAPQTQTHLFPHGCIAQCPVNPLTPGVCRDSFYPLHNGGADMYSESQFFSRHLEKMNSNSSSNRFQEAGLILAGVPPSTYESPTQESGADYEDPNLTSSQQNDYYDYDYSLAGNHLQGSVSTTNINFNPRGDHASTTPKRHLNGGSNQKIHRRSYCAAIDDKVDQHPGGMIMKNSNMNKNNSRSKGFLEVVTQPEDSGCGTLSLGSFAESPHGFDYNTARGLVGAAGGRISVPDFGASLIIPPNSVDPGKKLEFSLTVNTNESFSQLQMNLLNGSFIDNKPYKPYLSPSTSLASPIVSVGPADIPFSKPLILTIPHFLFLRPLANLAEGVAVNTLDSDWTIAVIAIGCSNKPIGSASSTSIYNKDNYQIYENFFATGEDIHIIINSLAPNYCIVACPKTNPGNPGVYDVDCKARQFAKRVRVAVFASQRKFLSRKSSKKSGSGGCGSRMKPEDDVIIRVYCFPDLLEAWQSVLENEEIECDEKDVLKNLMTSQKLLPEHFTSMNLNLEDSNDKRCSRFMGGSDLIDVNDINLRLLINDCHPQQQVISLSSVLSLHSMFQFVRFTHSRTASFKSPYVNEEMCGDITKNMTSSSSSANELFLNISRVSSSTETSNAGSAASSGGGAASSSFSPPGSNQQQVQPLSHIIAITLPEKEDPTTKVSPCVFSPLMNADAPVFRIVGPLRQKLTHALGVNSSPGDCLLPTVFQPSGVQILAVKLGVYEVLNSHPNKTSSASQSELVLNIWEVLGYKRTFLDEINQRRHFETLLSTLGAIGRPDLREEVNIRLLSLS